MCGHYHYVTTNRILPSFPRCPLTAYSARVLVNPSPLDNYSTAGLHFGVLFQPKLGMSRLFAKKIIIWVEFDWNVKSIYAVCSLSLGNERVFGNLFCNLRRKSHLLRLVFLSALWGDDRRRHFYPLTCESDARKEFKLLFDALCCGLRLHTKCSCRAMIIVWSISLHVVNRKKLPM